MKQVLTKGIILSRTNFGEADRIITVITPDHGKVKLMAKGVRKSTSKLAGGIELFCISQISFIPGKGDISMLVSTRLINNFGNIVKNVERTMLGYELLKRLNRATEDAAGKEYFDLLETTLAALNDVSVKNELVELWFNAQLLKLGGHQANLKTDTSGQQLRPEGSYMFDHNAMAFSPAEKGNISANDIKFLRLIFGAVEPKLLAQIKDAENAMVLSQQLISTMLKEYVHL